MTDNYRYTPIKMNFKTLIGIFLAVFMFVAVSASAIAIPENSANATPEKASYEAIQGMLEKVQEG